PVFHHESDVMLMVMHVRDPVRPLREIVPEIPPAVASVIEGCLAKDPKARPSSARAMAEALAHALGVKLDVRGSGAYAATTAAAPADLVRGRIDLAAAHEGVPDAGRSQVANPTAAHHAPVAPPVVAPPIATPPVPAPPAAPHAHGTPAANKPRSAPPPAPPPERAVRTEAEAAAAPPAPTEARPVERLDAPLGATAESTLNKLMLRLKRQGDFPAFAQNVGEVSKKADADAAYSASQLGASILKDYALTAKLLRAVNSMYANRFGGKIYSIQHAIVILGFDRVRSLALSISLFKGTGKSGQSQRISDSAISSLVSGEIARNLAFDAKVSDEEAMVCAMFRDLGRHLVVVYLPELYDQVMALAHAEHLSVRAASERTLGTTFARLGVAVAQTWRLPPRLLTAIASVPSAGGPLTRAEDRLSSLAEFANDLCEIVASASSEVREREIAELLSHHRHLLSIEQDKIPELLEAVQASFQERFSSLLGLDIKASRFLNNVAEVVKANATPGASPETAPSADAHPAAAHAAVAVPAHPAAAAPERVAVAPLELGRRLVEAPAPDDAAALEARLTELRRKLSARVPADVVLADALDACAQALGTSKLLVLVATPGRDAFVVRYGVRDDIDTLAKELSFPLKLGRGLNDVFSSAYQTGRDARVEDALSPRMHATMPARYYEVIGSEAFALYPCVERGVPSALLFVDADSARSLPDPSRTPRLDPLRPLLAQAAALRS
ncbi:MAG TPA: HDOD domain-containing protein, partial [Polyangiaceae bacterium]|nr:HDOD domain-containing protein [Polyangiaceae bacterium]